MTPAARGRLRAQLEELIQKWRDREASYHRSAESADHAGDIATWNVYDSMAADLKECADDLAALLGVQQEEEQTKRYNERPSSDGG